MSSKKTTSTKNTSNMDKFWKYWDINVLSQTFFDKMSLFLVGMSFLWLIFTAGIESLKIYPIVACIMSVIILFAQMLGAKFTAKMTYYAMLISRGENTSDNYKNKRIWDNLLKIGNITVFVSMTVILISYLLFVCSL